MSGESSHRTRFERVVDNLRFRMFFTGFMCLLYLLNLVLAALSFHIYPNQVYGALAYHVVLAIASCAYSVFFLWRNLDGCSKKRVWGFFGLNLIAIAFWLAAFFALIVELAQTGNPNNSNSQGSQSSSRRLLARQSQSGSSNSNSQSQTNFYPAIGCVVVDVGIAFMFLVNLVYIYFRQQKLFPKYAELNEEEGQAFDSQMAENDTHDEDTAQEEQQNQTQGGFSSYGAYEGQDDYRPGANYAPPPRYGAGASTPPSRYGADSSYPSQGYGQAGYGRPQYPPNAAHEDTAYRGQTAYSQPHSNARVSPTPYPRDSMM